MNGSEGVVQPRLDTDRVDLIVTPRGHINFIAECCLRITNRLQSDRVSAASKSQDRLDNRLIKRDLDASRSAFERFNLAVLGDIEFSIDDEPLNFPDRWAYRGMMFSGIPNMIWVFGYLRTSWTMRADMISEFVCKLLNHMKEKGAATCTPELREEDKQMPALPFIDPENFNPGYLQRSLHMMPKQGDHEPWTFRQDYYVEKEEIPNADLDDGTLVYGS